MAKLPDREPQRRLKDQIRQEAARVGNDRASGVYVPNTNYTRPARAVNLSGLSPTLLQIVANYDEAADTKDAIEAKARVNEMVNSSKWADLVDSGMSPSATPTGDKVIQDGIARKGLSELDRRVNARYDELQQALINDEASIGNLTETIDTIRMEERSKLLEEGGHILHYSPFQKGRFEELYTALDGKLRQDGLRKLSEAKDIAGRRAVKAALFEDMVATFAATHSSSNPTPDLLATMGPLVEGLQARADRVADGFGMKASPDMIAGALIDAAEFLRNSETRGEPDYTEDVIESWVADISERVTARVPRGMTEHSGGPHKRESLATHPLTAPIIAKYLAQIGDSASATGNSVRNERSANKLTSESIDDLQGFLQQWKKDPRSFNLDVQLTALYTPLAGNSDILALAMEKSRERFYRMIELDRGINKQGATIAMEAFSRRLLSTATTEEVFAEAEGMRAMPGVDIQAVDAAALRRVAAIEGETQYVLARRMTEDLDSELALFPQQTERDQELLAALSYGTKRKLQDLKDEVVEPMVAGGKSAIEIEQALSQLRRDPRYTSIIEEARTAGKTRKERKEALLQQARDNRAIGRPDVAVYNALETEGLISAAELRQIREKTEHNADPESIMTPMAKGLRARYFATITGMMRTDDGRNALSGIVAQGYDEETGGAKAPDLFKMEQTLTVLNSEFDQWIKEAHKLVSDPTLSPTQRESKAYDFLHSAVLGKLGGYAGEDLRDKTKIEPLTDQGLQEVYERALRSAHDADGEGADATIDEVQSELAQAAGATGIVGIGETDAPEDLDRARRAYSKLREFVESGRRGGNRFFGMDMDEDALVAWARGKTPKAGAQPRIPGEGPFANQRTLLLRQAFGPGGTRLRETFMGLLSDDAAGAISLSVKDRNTSLSAVGVPFEAWLEKQKMTPRGLWGRKGGPASPEILARENAEDERTLAAVAANEGYLYSNPTKRHPRGFYYKPGRNPNKERTDGPVEKLERLLSVRRLERAAASESLTIDTTDVRWARVPMFRNVDAYNKARSDSRTRKAVANRLGVKVNDPLEAQFWINQRLLTQITSE